MAKISKDYLDLYSKYEIKNQIDDFNQKRKNLNSEILSRLNENISNYEFELVQSISKMPDTTLSEYNEKEWLWNNGYYRTNEEVLLKNKEIDNENYIKSNDAKFNQYKLLCVIPFLIWLLIIERLESGVYAIMIAIYTFIIPLIISCILSIIASQLKLKELEKHNYPTYTKEYCKEKNNSNSGKIGLSLALFSLFRKSKTRFKETKDPDTWHELK